MKVVQINTVCGSGSTGKICLAVSKLLTQIGVENYIFYSAGNSDCLQGKRYQSKTDIKMQALKSRIFGNYGFNSSRATRRLIKQLEEIKPDIIHLHNIHGHNVHLDLLFSYLKEKKVKVFWTFHDCWAFTGYCPYYDLAKCNQWKTGCFKCSQRKKYSWFFDRSEYLFKKKKELFTGLELTIITPSRWLAEQVKQSFLNGHEVKVINNGIDLSVFCPRDRNFKEKYKLKDKFIVLGVAFGWGKRKGLDVFIELSKSFDERFQIVLVGTNENIDKQLPDNIISIHRTQNQTELAEIYTAADVFVNPTREENFPTTHMEALACGTPVIAFDTGGCSEMIDATCGCVVDTDDIDTLKSVIMSVCLDKPFSSESCLLKAQKFSANEKFDEYIELYRLGKYE